MGTATTVKVFIDIFIGVWAFVLAWIWSAKIERQAGRATAKCGEIWQRFPKFVIGYVVTFLIDPADRRWPVAWRGGESQGSRWARPTPSAAFSSC